MIRCFMPFVRERKICISDWDSPDICMHVFTGVLIFNIYIVVRISDRKIKEGIG